MDVKPVTRVVKESAANLDLKQQPQPRLEREHKLENVHVRAVRALCI
jgi:hypothetical protein